MEDEDFTLDRNLVFSSSSDVSKLISPALVPGPDAITISTKKEIRMKLVNKLLLK